MANQKIGSRSIIFDQAPVITAWASVAGKKESEGPLAHYFDIKSSDSYWGEKTWEQAELTMQKIALTRLLEKANLTHDDLDLVCSGDLLNQCIGSSFSLRNMNIPHLGLYGACSTMVEAIIVSAMSVGGGFFNYVAAMTSSHFASSERQYRFPLGYGAQRTPTAQWTVTGAGAALISNKGLGPRITSCTLGTVYDLGICDANNMGAAMAPAAMDTIKNHFNDLKTSADDYDLIITGDLGQIGKELLLSLSQKEGFNLGGKLTDCGTLIFDIKNQDVHAGGSGCGCSAVTLCSYLLEKLNRQKLKNILFCGTGALLSPTSTQQGLPISGVCHAVSICGGSK